jgi:molybdopterin synthase sulfur carrier subunit
MTDHIAILYFASLREQLGRDREEVELTGELSTVADVREYLAQRKGQWQAVFNGADVLAAVNQQMAKAETSIKAGDEIAFFPPVTGG